MITPCVFLLYTSKAAHSLQRVEANLDTRTSEVLEVDSPRGGGNSYSFWLYIFAFRVNGVSTFNSLLLLYLVLLSKGVCEMLQELCSIRNNLQVSNNANLILLYGWY